MTEETHWREVRRQIKKKDKERHMANAAKKNVTGMVGSVKMSEVDINTLIAAAKKLKCGTDKDPAAALVANLQAKFSKLPANRLADCTKCGGESDKELDVCPYCGDENEDDEDESASSDASDDEDASSSASASDDVEVVETPAANKRRLKAPGPPPIGIAGGANLVQYNENDLNKAVANVIACKGESTVSMWRLGAAIGEIFDKSLWKQRNGPEGLPVYKNFTAFVTKELSFTYNNALWLIDIAKNYSEAQVREFGTTMLGTVLTAPKQDRARLLAAAKAGATVREVRELAHEAADSAGTGAETRDTGRSKPTKKGKRAKPAKKKAAAAATKAPTITVASIIGKQTVKLYKKGHEDKRALNVADSPTGMLELSNGVAMHFVVAKDPQGQMVIRVDTKRIEA